MGGVAPNRLSQSLSISFSIITNSLHLGLETAVSSLALGPAQIQGERTLVAIACRQIRAIEAAVKTAEGVASLGSFGLDHVRAQVRKHQAGERRGDHGAKIENSNSLELAHAGICIVGC